MRVFAITVVFGVLLSASQAPVQSARTVTVPYKAEYYSCEGQPDGRFFNHPFEKGNGFRMIADLNFDGREDLILSKSGQTGGTCGNSGCAVAIFLLQPDKTYKVLDFWLHPLAAGTERLRAGEGQLVTYGRSSASEGVLAFDRVTADSLTRINTQTIHVNNSPADQALYASWFSGPRALKAQYSRCAKGKLEWSDSSQ